MSRRGRRLTLALAALVLLLFAGQWGSRLLADRWWAARLSPPAVDFLTGWHVLHLVLLLAGMLVAAAWFIGHMLVVYRAVGSVQVRRNVANLEIREALTPGSLLSIAVGAGALLGVLTGGGPARHAAEVALAWQGVSYGVADPLLQHDAGLYVAQLPVWLAARSYCWLLVTLALAAVFALYLLVGAVRWIDGRPAINGHARTHLGWLLVALALLFMWGYLLEPYRLVGSLNGPPDLAVWRATRVTAPVLAGVALATAILSAIWAVRARHAIAAAGWIVLPLASLVGHWMVPPAVRGQGEPAADERTIEQLRRLAFGLESLTEAPAPTGTQPHPPVVPSLWNITMATRLVAADSVDVVSADPAVVTIGGRSRPVWLAARVLPRGGLVVTAQADDRAGPAGQALFYRGQDSLPVGAAVPFLELDAQSYHPESPAYRLGTVDDPGVLLDSWIRRLPLAWALQAPELLGPLALDARVDWALAPGRRLSRLAPFAEWGEPVARLVDGELIWIAEGYLPVPAFPLSQRLEWHGRRVAGLRAGLLGTVSARSGATRIFIRPGSDALASAWAAVANGVIEPAPAIPEGVWRAAPYPREQFLLQARLLERKEDGLTGTAGMAGEREPPEAPRAEIAWAADTTGPVLTAAFERPGQRRLRALLMAGREEGDDALWLARFDSATAPPSASALESRWARFPSFDALNDSIRDDGGRLERGPVRYDVGPVGIVAYQSHFAAAEGGRPVLAWVTVAAGDRLGAGHTLAEAWSNLLGASVPAIAGQPQTTRLDEARRQLQRADSALRAAEWAAFGRDWEGLKSALGFPADSGAP
jgi:uncharacterized membrane protein (UPF0182 family)